MTEHSLTELWDCLWCMLSADCMGIRLWLLKSLRNNCEMPTMRGCEWLHLCKHVQVYFCVHVVFVHLCMCAAMLQVTLMLLSNIIEYWHVRGQSPWWMAKEGTASGGIRLLRGAGHRRLKLTSIFFTASACPSLSSHLWPQTRESIWICPLHWDYPSPVNLIGLQASVHRESLAANDGQ